MKFKQFPVITKKIIFYILIAVFLLCSLVFAISYISFNHQFREQYDASIREIAEAASDFLNPDDFAKYRENPVPDEKYNTVLENLQTLVDNFDLNVIYVSAVEPPEYTHIFYYYDPVNKHGKWSPYPLGYEEEYYEESYNRTTRLVYEKGEHLVRHTIKSRSGSHITAQIPVYDSNGKIVALLGAQKNIQEFVNARARFVQFVIITVLITALFFVVLFAGYFNLRFIKPIVQITDETNRFASSSEKPNNNLLSVKNRDELGVLANSVYQMEGIVSTNIETLNRMTTETAEALASAIDAKDKYTRGHSARVADYSRSIARKAGKSESECRSIYLSALLHDVGKIGVPNSIINKNGKLTEEEFKVIKTHPDMGVQILVNITQIPNICDGAHYHHERYDGKGYPEGLSGEDIPEIGRLIAVADAYDAMTSNRSYRGTLTQEHVRKEIENGIGTQFDPEFAKIMLELIDDDKDYTMREVE
ncbi:HD-GYP domain-containing protein [Treponema sp. UBA3813]|uniref:HD-GYP domain-containing protein n=1 Tax=Treponema sp. UBA3813 TaxID=1947715 RepID=UPI0025DA12A8|nr:HD-GYP domain-containing protein [Treponema sp. UBA3813]